MNTIHQETFSLKVKNQAHQIYQESINKSTLEQKAYLRKIESLYKDHPTDDVANVYAKLLFDLSFKLTTNLKKEEVINKLKILFVSHETETIAECIGRLKYNSLSNENVKSSILKNIANEIEQLYKKFPTTFLAEPLAKIWYRISVSRAKDHRQYEKKILDLCSHVNDSNTNTAYAKILFEPNINIEDRDKLVHSFLNGTQDIDSFWTYFNSTYYPRYNDHLNNFKLDESYPVESLNKKINQYLKKLSKESNYIALKIKILSILYCTLQIKNLLAVPKNDKLIGHYTRMQNLKYLISDDEKFGKLRMYNASYMNDPLEGKTLLDFLSVNDHMQQELSSKIYLSCFTTAIDELPMWSMYGDDGQGCCLILSEKYFDYTDEFVSDELMLQPDNNSTNNYLYRVCYLSDKSKTFNIEISTFKNDAPDLIKNITDWLNNLNIHVQDLLEINKTNNKLVDEIMEFILGQIKYLFKDMSYSHEQELRLIRYSENPKLDDSSWIVPQLYVESRKTLEYKQLIFGPKVSQSNRIIPYLVHTKKVKEIKKSDIKYR